MAIRSVGYIAPQDEVQTKKAKKGGGEWGAAIGGVVGGVAGALAGTPAGPAGMVAGGIAGAGGGTALGQRVGEWVSPSRQESTAITRRMQTSGPQMMDSGNSDKLKQSILALQSQPAHIQAEYGKPLVEAYMTSLAKENVA